MKLWSDSWTNGERIPAALRRRPARRRRRHGLFRQRQPAPRLERRCRPATQSLVLICHDFDVPSRGDDVNQAGREIPADLPRVDFFHWLLADVPASRARDRRGRVQQRLLAARQAGPAVTAPGSSARARASTTSPAGSPATRRSPATTSATTARTRPGTTRSSTITCSRSTRSRWRARRSRAASAAPSCARRSTGTCWPKRCTRAPTRSTAGSDEAARRRGDARRRRPPRRDGVERRDAHAGPARHRPQRARPLAGVARSPRRSPARASRRSSRATWRAPTTRRRRSPRSSICRSRPTPACASAASASSRATPTPRSTRAGPADAARWRRHDPAFAPEGGESLRRFQRARASPRSTRHRRARAGRTILVVSHGGVLDCLYRAASGLDLAAPRSWELGNADINRLLFTGERFTLVGWSDTAHLDGDPLDDGSEGDCRPCRGATSARAHAA